MLLEENKVEYLPDLGVGSPHKVDMNILMSHTKMINQTSDKIKTLHSSNRIVKNVNTQTIDRGKYFHYYLSGILFIQITFEILKKKLINHLEE